MKVKFKNKNGASAVEFAIILPILVLIVFGIIEFSVILYDKAIITNASREGARAGILYRTDDNGDPDPLSDIEVKQVVNDYLYPPGQPQPRLRSLGASSSTPTINVDSPPASMQPRKVVVTYQYKFLVLPNFITSLTGGINLEATTIMVME